MILNRLQEIAELQPVLASEDVGIPDLTAFRFQIEHNHIRSCCCNGNDRRQKDHPKFGLLNSVGKRLFDWTWIVVSLGLMCCGIFFFSPRKHLWSLKTRLVCAGILIFCSVFVLFHGLSNLILKR